MSSPAWRSVQVDRPTDIYTPMHLPSLIYGPMHLSSLIYAPMPLPCFCASAAHLVCCAYACYCCIVAHAVFSRFITTPPITGSNCTRQVCMTTCVHTPAMACAHSPCMPCNSMRLQPSDCASPNNTRTHRHNFCTKHLCNESSTHTHTHTHTHINTALRLALGVYLHTE